MFILVRLNGATSVTNLASWCVAPSFSPPTDCMRAIWLAVAAVGMPSMNSRSVCGSGGWPSNAWLAPTMSLLNMPCTSLPAAAICAAMKPEPYSPCSSPATVANTRVPGNWWVANTPGELEHDRHARTVVIGAGGVAGEVEHVGHPRVQVAGHDVVPRRRRGARQASR